MQAAKSSRILTYETNRSFPTDGEWHLKLMSRAAHSPHQDKARPLWKTTFRSGPLLEYVLFGECREKTEVYRWRWLAERAALRHSAQKCAGIMSSAFVEPYWPGTNVVSLRRPHHPAGRLVRTLVRH
jgi:hypothetical protein